ncbi:Sodium/calcium exchanger protein-domain-containing protein [Pilobolus umbonatus]|nr:Sodium/calcium exchanger protein-domain-containing protein [Pilobolus umbonatus]
MSVGRNIAILFSLLFIFKCLRYSWSQSGHMNSSFIKRDGVDNYSCDNIDNAEDKCSYALEYCMDATPGLLNYIQLYYCSSVKPFVFIVLCLWLLFLFGFVGIAASDFFCPNLQTIASALHLSESLTGVTFLALGNGSPDLFSTFSAMQSNMGSLALGELIGAASFIVSVVAGSMCAIKPFRAKKFSFIRDVSFFTCAILLVMMIVADGYIHLYEAIILIVFYIVYVLTVVGGNYYMKKRSNYLNLVERARLEYEENDGDVDNLLRGNAGQEYAAFDDEMELYDEGFETEGFQDFNYQRNGALPKLRIRTSLFSAIEFQDVVQSLRTNSIRYNGRRSNHIISQSPVIQPIERYRDNLQLHTAESRQNIPQLQDIPTPSVFRRVISRLSSSVDIQHIRGILFPSLIDIHNKSVFSKISSVLSTPVIFLLTITLPVIRESALKPNTIELTNDMIDSLEDYNEEEIIPGDSCWLKWLTAVQIVTGPLLIAFLFSTQEVSSGKIAYSIAIIIGLVTCTLFWFTTSSLNTPRLYWMMAFIGFGIAVVWIYLIANEVVSVLQAIGMAVGISEAILGLTIFALGNSLGDFVANVTMAKMGYPLMAMSACFGGPMLNIMLGMGIGATYVTSQRNEPYAIAVSKTILVSATGLLIVLITSLIFVPLNGYRMGKGFGYTWIGIYLICTAINLMIEINS